jgi:hypothetical protein
MLVIIGCHHSANLKGLTADIHPINLDGLDGIPNSRIEKTTFRPGPKSIRRKYVRKI